MTKPTRLILEKRLNKVSELLHEGKSSFQISEILGIPYSTVQRYVHTVTERQQQKWRQIESETLESRALKIKKYYQDIADKAESKLDDPNISAKDLEIAAKLLIACNRNIYEMLRSGPLRFTSIPVKEIEDKN